MMKYLVFISLIFIFFSCNKDNITENEKVNVLDSDFIVTYEIKFPYPTKLTGTNYIIYWTENETEQYQAKEQLQNGITVWTKTFTAKLKEKGKSYKLGFKSQSLVRLTGPGNARCSISINGHEVTYSNNASTDSSNDIGPEIDFYPITIYF